MKLLLGQRCFIVAEVAQAHEGSINLAHSFIDLASQAGADAIKFQTHIAEQESTYDEPWRIKFSYSDKSRYDYWQRMEFSEQEWIELSEHAQESGLHFLSSPFSVQAVKQLGKLDMPFWKIASGEIHNNELLEAVWGTKRPVIFSTGLSSTPELERVILRTKEKGIDFAILQCTSKYPTPPEDWGLNQLELLRKKFGCPVGLSDHSGDIYAGLAACTLGADILEVHITYSKKMFGPDTTSSLTFDELSRLITGVKQVDRSLKNPVLKDVKEKHTEKMSEIFGRSLSLTRDLKKGDVITPEDLILRKPGNGIPDGERDNIIGKKLAQDKSSKYLLNWEDFT